MSLVFTNAQVQTMSSDLVTLPTKITAPGSGLNAQKAAYVAQAPGLLATDQNLQVFSDAYIAAITAYHAELVELNDDLRTDYDGNDIVLAAQGDKSNSGHFPISPVWIRLTPELLPSNTGLPASVSGLATEAQNVAPIQPFIDRLRAGFSYGSSSGSGTMSGSSISLTAGVSGIAAGNKLLVTCGSLTAIATVISYSEVIVPGDPMAIPPTMGSDTVTIVIAVTDGAIANGACSFQNFLPGFTDAQRTGADSLGAYAGAYALNKSEILAAVLPWQTTLVAEQTALSANQDPSQGSANAAALADVNAALLAISTWQALSDLVTGGQLSEAGLAPLIAAYTERETAAPARVTAIYAALGSVTQSSDGTYTGTGIYYSLFSVVDLRCSLGVGTLTKYYTNVNNAGFFDKQISSINAQVAQYQSVMYVSLILANTTVGQQTFALNSISGLTIGSAVLVMDNASITYARTITGISGNSVTLNSGIPIVLTAANLARVVKLK
jgi:hypothetical protein